MFFFSDLKYVEIQDRAIAEEKPKLGDVCGRHGSASNLVRLSHDGDEEGLEDEEEFNVLNKVFFFVVVVVVVVVVFIVSLISEINV